MVAEIGNPPIPSARGERSPCAVLYAALGYLFFVVYGSLILLDYHYHPLGEAFAQFPRILCMQLGVPGYADRLAKVVLNALLAYLMSAWLASDPVSGVVRLLKSAWVYVVSPAA